MHLRPWLLALLVVASLAPLAGCAGADVSVGGPPRCDRTGDEDQRRAC
jgi:hypothetical protein